MKITSFLEWVADGKPRSGYLHQMMCRTRAEFKLALHRCRAAEEQLRADARTSQLANKQHPRAFWNGIKKIVAEKLLTMLTKSVMLLELKKCVACGTRKSRYH